MSTLLIILFYAAILALLLLTILLFDNLIRMLYWIGHKSSANGRIAFVSYVYLLFIFKKGGFFY